LTKDGIKIGTKASIYMKSSKYKKDGNREFGVEYQKHEWTDKGIVDFQSNIKTSNRKITRIIDKNISTNRKITDSQIISKYGKPLLTDTVEDVNNNAARVDVYENITFFYKWDTKYDKAPILDGVVIMHNKTKTARDTWLNYINSEMNNDVINMNSHISSSEWANL